MLTVVPVAAAYLLGAIPFALIISRLYGVADIRKVGSGNLGATNVWRVLGFKAAVWVFIGDIGKGVAAVLLARYWTANFQPNWFAGEVLYVVCAAAVVFGHVFPVFIGFRGGKGVNTALGAMVTLLPIETLLSLAIFALTLGIFRYVSLGSITAALGFMAIVMIERYVMRIDVALVYVLLSAALAALIVVTHRKNIARLTAGTESRFSFSSKMKGERRND